jgi:hypothetical protein
VTIRACSSVISLKKNNHRAHRDHRNNVGEISLLFDKGEAGMGYEVPQAAQQAYCNIRGDCVQMQKKGAWLDVKKGGSFLRMEETAGCFLNSFSRKSLTSFLFHPDGWTKSV